MAILFPSLVTFAYFVALAGQAAAVQQAAYVIGKAIQFGFPAVWVFWVLQEKWRWSRPTVTGVSLGLAFGLLVSAAMLGLYYAWLAPAGFFAGPDQAIREKIAQLGLSTAWGYAALGLFYALGHSLLEEYYWRWFVFRQLRRHAQFSAALLISSGGFALHHVIVLATYFGWDSPATYLFTGSIAVGGAVWAWLYERCSAIYGPWISHCVVDAAIFWLGYELARDLLV